MCCFAKGIPMIVIAMMMAKIICVTAIQIPPTRIQIIFIIMERHPLADLVVTISFPNGTRPRMDNLMHCKPKGIPIIVTHNNKPPIRYSKNMKIPPPSIIHKILPIVLTMPPSKIAANILFYTSVIILYCYTEKILLYSGHIVSDKKINKINSEIKKLSINEQQIKLSELHKR
jgi:hypothetical protein